MILIDDMFPAFFSVNSHRNSKKTSKTINISYFYLRRTPVRAGMGIKLHPGTPVSYCLQGTPGFSGRGAWVAG
jgi:hypothetical protein